ncbi:hypothetical protein LTR27_006011 [Elasticomyces elasticus]|nr:hypothetical protein LTR27_006011 [Elasticomyces elasticus]
MDAAFDIRGWQPTRPPELGEEDLTPRLPDLINTLNTQTKDLQQHPYDPELWLHRATTLASLRFPELAVGDTYKALLLCRTINTRLREGRWQLGHRMGFWMLDESEHGTAETDELEQRIANLQSESHHVEVENLSLFPAEEKGLYLQRPYPWMRPEHRERDDELLDLLNKELLEQTTKEGHIKPICTIQRHAFGKRGLDGADSSELLGVFATRDLVKDTSLLTDESRCWGCIGPGLGGNTLNLHGGTGCGDPLHPNMESDHVNFDLRWVRERAGKDAAEPIALCRFLLCCREDKVEHPLNHHLIARLTPTYRKEKQRLFSREHDIVIPNDWLQQLGIDIFANANYDTWVLFEMKAREENNSWSDPIHCCVSPLFSLFNHSCDMNVQWNIDEDHTSLTIHAHRDIIAGEQLFVCYDQYMESQPVQARKKRMRKWLDEDCPCSRCVREAEEEAMMPKINGGSDGEATPSWDTAEKPVLPEDRMRKRTKHIPKVF